MKQPQRFHIATGTLPPRADLVVVGPEQPLVDGLADRLRAKGTRVFGPGADGAELEGSKQFMKDLVTAAGVPTARYQAFTDVEPALAFLRTLPGLYVVKTDGLAAGKGVLVTESLAEAEEDVQDKLSGSSFGAAGRRVVIEDRGPYVQGRVIDVSPRTAEELGMRHDGVAHSVHCKTALPFRIQLVA